MISFVIDCFAASDVSQKSSFGTAETFTLSPSWFDRTFVPTTRTLFCGSTKFVDVIAVGDVFNTLGSKNTIVGNLGVSNLIHDNC